ncbi:gibberellin 3-beta-dioxygenase 1 [Vigna radiata var. radiata]|uniref:Gibberellin 3-beta-dioxygenase 1 n=1 Tax=Vigna radiata var. radiata TaxID=3916 RepID=A0A1S3U4B6_VIGRR|nr:gibberellin 3-beta-dioxygenase 1 [Vigna radiata var. radiata]
MKMSTLNEAYLEHPLTLGDIIPIDFSSSLSLPDSHTWSQPIDDDVFSLKSPVSSPMPIIDMMDPNAKKLIALACENWGGFHLKNHGIPLAVIQGAEDELQRLFSLPIQQKMKALRSPAGATGYGIPRISPFFPKFMWHEGFTIIGSPSHDAKKLWPNDYQQFSDKMEKYQKEMNTLAEVLTETVLDVLEIPEEKRKWMGTSDVSTILQLNFYPSCPEPNRAMGLAPHTDSSIFTIVNVKESGLQLMKEGKWIPVQPPPDTLLVHAGDFLHMMSNGRFCSPLHRVVSTVSKKRFSIAYFYSPPTDYVVSPSLTGDLDVARFRDVTVMEYIGIKADNFGKSLSVIST